MPRALRPSSQHNAATLKNGRTGGASSIIKVSRNARFCPAGHCFHSVLLSERQSSLKREQKLSDVPPIECNGCSIEIRDSSIAGSCKICDIDFCQDCYTSGLPVEELLEAGWENELDSTVSTSMNTATSSITGEQCSLGHPLCRISTRLRRRYLQERNGLQHAPAIECDCCSALISCEFIAGCCVECDIDFCEACFRSGQSFEDTLKDRKTLSQSKSNTPVGMRYNGLRPTYKGTGRVSYDDYPDPTSFRWLFTGSCEAKRVEFFEKDYGNKVGLVQLNFFYAEGRVVAILQCSRKGERKILTEKHQQTSPPLFRKILLDPCGHRERVYKRQMVV